MQPRELHWMIQELKSRRTEQLRWWVSRKHRLNPTKSLNIYEQQLLAKWKLDRKRGKPLQYILGNQPFASTHILTRPPVLIPRPETEDLTLKLVDQISDKQLRVLDLCSGSGCISIALSHHCKNIYCRGIDINHRAVLLSLLNRRLNRISSGKLDFHLGDLFKNVSTVGFDLVVCNPPYIPPSDFYSLDPGVKDWEDERALIAQDEGLLYYKRVVSMCKDMKGVKGLPIIAFEYGGKKQTEALTKIVQEGGFQARVEKDLFGRDRFFFDFISPYAYVHFNIHYSHLSTNTTLYPVLFASLLKKYSNLGPAEIPPKKTFIMRQCSYISHKHNIPFTPPLYHPFNPLPLLRLCTVKNNDAAITKRLFEFVWKEGNVPQSSEWNKLLEELRVSPDEINDPKIKEKLIENSKLAISQGVFGVPSLAVDNQVFFGLDSMQMYLDYIAGDEFFRSSAYLNSRGKEGIHRKQYLQIIK